MSLLALQTSMIAMVANSAGAPDVSHLQPEEAVWLRQLEQTRGIDVARDVHRWWRVARLTASLPLTCRLIDRVHDAAKIYAAYMECCPCRSLFFVQEGEQFVRTLCEGKHERVHPYVLPLAQFELAMRAAKTQRKRALESGMHHAPSSFTMPVDPRQLIDALLRAAALPEPGAVTVHIDSASDRGWHVSQLGTQSPQAALGRPGQ